MIATSSDHNIRINRPLHWQVSPSKTTMLPIANKSAAPVAAAIAGVAGGEAAAEEQTEFDVLLTSFGDKKIQVIKEVRSITSLGLKEAKELVESAPAPVKVGVEKAEAEKIKEQLEAAGAQADIK